LPPAGPAEVEAAKPIIREIDAQAGKRTFHPTKLPVSGRSALAASRRAGIGKVERRLSRTL